MSETMECTCDTWKANIDRLDAPLLLAQIRGYKWDCEVFRFCPWCGAALSVTDTSAAVQP